MRKYSYVRAVTAGCEECSGSKIKWEGKNAQGVAVQHHDRYGHHVWVYIEMELFYPDVIPENPKKPLQPKLI